MALFGIREIDALLNDGVGNTGVLNQVKRAMQRGEVVSATEHAYVQRLVNARLAPKTRPTTRTVGPAIHAQPQAPATPRVAAMRRKRGILRTLGTAVTRRRRPDSRRERERSRLRLSRKKVAVFSLIIIVISAGAYASVLTQQPNVQPEAPLLPAGVMIDTDHDAYFPGDIILVNGRSAPGTPVLLTIESAGGVTVWEEQVTTGSDGIYSTIVIAGGAMVVGATHTVTAVDGVGTHAAEFQFLPKR